MRLSKWLFKIIASVVFAAALSSCAYFSAGNEPLERGNQNCDLPILAKAWVIQEDFIEPDKPVSGAFQFDVPIGPSTKLEDGHRTGGELIAFDVLKQVAMTTNCNVILDEKAQHKGSISFTIHTNFERKFGYATLTGLTLGIVPSVGRGKTIVKGKIEVNGATKDFQYEGEESLYMGIIVLPALPFSNRPSKTNPRIMIGRKIGRDYCKMAGLCSIKPGI